MNLESVNTYEGIYAFPLRIFVSLVAGIAISLILKCHYCCLLGVLLKVQIMRIVDVMLFWLLRSCTGCLSSQISNFP